MERLSEFHASSVRKEEVLQAEMTEIRRAICEAADSFTAEKKSLEESHNGLSLRGRDARFS